MPSWPLRLLPQHFTPPVLIDAQVCASPTLKATTPLLRPPTSTGVTRVETVPSPSWPLLPRPQHFMPPLLVKAHVCSRPAPIANADYRLRRQALMAALPADSAVLLPGASLVTRSRDSEFPFRQDSDFHYLTGFPEPDALLLLLPGRDEGESVLFCQDRDPTLEAWTGIRLGAEGAVREHGVDQAFENAERGERLAALLDGRRTLYLALDNEQALALAEEVRAELVSRVRRGARPPEAFADVAPLLHEARLVKSPAELALLRHAAEISARGHLRAMRASRPGLAEYQLQAELEHEFRRSGARLAAYGSIVATLGGFVVGVTAIALLMVGLALFWALRGLYTERRYAPMVNIVRFHVAAVVMWLVGFGVLYAGPYLT